MMSLQPSQWPELLYLFPTLVGAAFVVDLALEWLGQALRSRAGLAALAAFLAVVIAEFMLWAVLFDDPAARKIVFLLMQPFVLAVVALVLRSGLLRLWMLPCSKD